MTFIGDTNRWRAWTYAFVNDDTSQSQTIYLNAFDAGSQSDTLSAPVGDAFGEIMGAGLRASGWLLSAGTNFFEGYASVSSTATSDLGVGFWNMVIGAGTGVRLTGHGTAETWLRDTCVPSCGIAQAWASLYTSFGPEDPDNPGMPHDMTEQYSDLISYLDGSNVTGSGGLLHDVVEGDLTLNFENLSGADMIGRVRWGLEAPEAFRRFPNLGPGH